MRRVRKLLRLHYGTGASARAIARELGVSRSTVKEYLTRAAAAKLTWPLPVPIVDPRSGEIRPAQIFVGVLGASNYTYAEASWTQSLPDWIGAHVRMFAFFPHR